MKLSKKNLNLILILLHYRQLCHVVFFEGTKKLLNEETTFILLYIKTLKWTKLTEPINYNKKKYVNYARSRIVGCNLMEGFIFKRVIAVEPNYTIQINGRIHLEKTESHNIEDISAM